MPGAAAPGVEGHEAKKHILNILYGAPLSPVVESVTYILSPRLFNKVEGVHFKRPNTSHSCIAKNKRSIIARSSDSPFDPS